MPLGIHHLYMYDTMFGEYKQIHDHSCVQYSAACGVLSLVPNRSRPFHLGTRLMWAHGNALEIMNISFPSSRSCLWYPVSLMYVIYRRDETPIGDARNIYITSAG